jgi:hypothetical protein
MSETGDRAGGRRATRLDGYQIARRIRAATAGQVLTLIALTGNGYPTTAAVPRRLGSTSIS